MSVVHGLYRLTTHVEVIAKVNTPDSFKMIGEMLQTGHGVLGTTHAEDIEKLVNCVVKKGLLGYLLQEKCKKNLGVQQRRSDLSSTLMTLRCRIQYYHGTFTPSKCDRRGW